MEGNYLKIIFIIDESGSMHGTESDVIGGFNGFIEKQKAEQNGLVEVSLYKFNSEVSCIVSNEKIDSIALLSAESYKPGGYTALYDAIGTAIQNTDNQILMLEPNNRPDKVLAVIITDGCENASKHYSSTAIKSFIATHEELLKWNFIYLGCGLNDFSDAELLGIQHQASSRKEHLMEKWDNLSEYSVRYRNCKDQSADKANFDQLMNDLADE